MGVGLFRIRDTPAAAHTVESWWLNTTRSHKHAPLSCCNSPCCLSGTLDLSVTTSGTSMCWRSFCAGRRGSPATDLHVRELSAAACRCCIASATSCRTLLRQLPTQLCCAFSTHTSGQAQMPHGQCGSARACSRPYRAPSANQAAPQQPRCKTWHWRVWSSSCRAARALPRQCGFQVGAEQGAGMHVVQRQSLGFRCGKCPALAPSQCKSM